MISSKPQSTARLVAAAATCAALYAIVNILTSPIRTPWGVGEFRPGVVIPAFYALVFGPVPAALGAGIGSFIGDMISLVPGGGSTPIVAIVAGGIGNFLGFLVLGFVYEKIKGWRGFIAGTTSGLFVGNLWAAGGVVFLLHLPVVLILGFLLFWFGTMFPFVVFFVPALVRVMKPYASQISSVNSYPDLAEPNRKILWAWTIAVTALVLAGTVVIIGFQSNLIHGFGTIGTPNPGNSVTWIEILLIVSALSALIVGAFIPGAKQKEKIPVVS